MSFKAIFFDNDGTLVNTEPLFFQATKEVYAKAGVELTKGWYIDECLAKGVSTAELLRLKGLPPERINELRQERDERYSDLLRQETVPVIDGVVETLEKLQGHLVMGVVTSSGRKDFDVMMDTTGLGKYFSFSITADDVSNVKPYPEPYLKALQFVQLSKADCLVIEDSLRGVQAAKTAELTCFAIPDALTKTNDFSIADRTLNTIRELPTLVL